MRMRSACWSLSLRSVSTFRHTHHSGLLRHCVDMALHVAVHPMRYSVRRSRTHAASPHGRLWCKPLLGCGNLVRFHSSIAAGSRHLPHVPSVSLRKNIPSACIAIKNTCTLAVHIPLIAKASLGKRALVSSTSGPQSRSEPLHRGPGTQASAQVSCNQQSSKNGGEKGGLVGQIWTSLGRLSK